MRTAADAAAARPAQALRLHHIRAAAALRARHALRLREQRRIDFTDNRGTNETGTATAQVPQQRRHTPDPAWPVQAQTPQLKPLRKRRMLHGRNDPGHAAVFDVPSDDDRQGFTLSRGNRQVEQLPPACHAFHPDEHRANAA